MGKEFTDGDEQSSDQRTSVEVGSVEVGSDEVNLFVWMLLSPAIPFVCSLSKRRHLFLYCHRILLPYSAFIIEKRMRTSKNKPHYFPLLFIVAL
jgi:hypothetical protein